MTADVVGYVSDQAHSSLGRAARVLGFRPEQVRVLPHDAGFRLDPRAVAAAMDADVRAGRRPLFVAATAGTTNTGSIDPLEELADLCRERGVWLHVDAAYGGFAALTERGRAALRGIERADSVTLDPHKWLYQPYECGALLVRDDHTLRAAFQMTPDYLQDSERRRRRRSTSPIAASSSRAARARSRCGCRCSTSASARSARRSTARWTSPSSSASASRPATTSSSWPRRRWGSSASGAASRAWCPTRTRPTGATPRSSPASSAAASGSSRRRCCAGATRCASAS